MPVSAAGNGGVSATNASSATVTYTASDTNGAGVKTVDLYVSGPTDSGSYSKVATVTSGAASGSFSAYSFSEGEGTYSFYTRATDNATNLENAPTSPPDTTVFYDTTNPVSASALVPYTNGSNVTVGYYRQRSERLGRGVGRSVCEWPDRQRQLQQGRDRHQRRCQRQLPLLFSEGEGTLQLCQFRATDNATNLETHPAAPTPPSSTTPPSRSPPPVTAA